MRRGIIHIGTPRTGTSSLQTLLFGHRDRLREAGILYPELTPRSAPLPHLSHQHLGETLNGRRPRHERRELLARLDQALATSAADVVLLSYESLCLLPPWHRAPDLLCGVLERHGFRPEILMTVRPQAAYVQSQYTWRIQFLQEARPFAAAFKAELHLPRFDYLRCLENWARATEWRVHVVPVRDRRSKASLVERIATELGLADRLVPLLAPADLAYRTNQSLGPVATEVSRRLRASGAACTQTLARDVTMRIDALSRERGLDAEPFQALDPAMLDRASDAYRRTNNILARRVWGTDWIDRVDDLRCSAINEIVSLESRSSWESQIDDILRTVSDEFGSRIFHGISAINKLSKLVAAGVLQFSRKI